MGNEEDAERCKGEGLEVNLIEEGRNGGQRDVGASHPDGGGARARTSNTLRAASKRVYVRRSANRE